MHTTLTRPLWVCTFLLFLLSSTAQEPAAVEDARHALWHAHNKLRELHAATNPKVALYHADVILRHFPMDGYTLSKLDSGEAAGRADRIMAQVRENREYPHLGAALFIHLAEHTTDKAQRRKILKYVFDLKGVSLAPYRKLADERVKLPAAPKALSTILPPLPTLFGPEPGPSGMPAGPTPDLHKWAMINTVKGIDGKKSSLHTEAMTAGIGAVWYMDYLATTDPRFSNKLQKLYGYWRPALNAKGVPTHDITADIAAARAHYGPDETLYFYLCNEPNEHSQANVKPEDFPPVYLAYHQAIRAADKNIKILGPALNFWNETNDKARLGGRQWYEAFRNKWAATPACVAYCKKLAGHNYPPMDVFNYHLYSTCITHNSDAKNPTTVQMRDLYKDLDRWPETKGLKVWLTETGLLFEEQHYAAWGNSAEEFATGLIKQINKDARVEKAFWFMLQGDQSGPWKQTVLIDPAGKLTKWGQLFMREAPR